MIFGGPISVDRKHVKIAIFQSISFSTNPKLFQIHDALAQKFHSGTVNTSPGGKADMKKFLDFTCASKTLQFDEYD